MSFDEKFKVRRWYHIIKLHWIINPGLAIYELIFGQRIPKTSLEDQTDGSPRPERSYIPCPHCGKKHKGITWSKKNGTAFRNWFGLYCPNCGNVIPCIMNILTFLILAITFPIWGWFRKSIKSKWLEKQSSRYENLNLEYSHKCLSNYVWIKTGLTWGGIMFIFMTFLFPLMVNESITWESILIAVPIWTVAGLGWGYFMKWYLSKTGKKQSTRQT